MAQLSPIQLEDGTIIYIESTEEETTTPPTTAPQSEDDEEEIPLTTKGGVPTPKMPPSQSIQNTIKTYTNHTLTAFKDIAAANIDKVTLEFGVKIGGKAGIPYITQGSAESNLKITVECSFPAEKTDSDIPE